MIVGHCQGAMHRMLARFGQHQAGQGRAGAAGQPPAVVVAPAQTAQLLVDHGFQLHAAYGARQTAATFRHRLQIGISRPPWLPETGCVPCAITAITQPVQRHAERLQVLQRGGVLRMSAQQTDSGETEAFAGGSQGMQVIGVGTAEADDALGPGQVSGLEVFGELEPLVAADQRVDLVQAQDGDFDA
ncbi:hypothetical protein PS710_03734 [Pseudomonas fluorescens]|uniref:Uncharacterized protein n=1 Tax=Pseudomonas fluorescens TaxID=294 RepID=A0A5E7DYF0_PSEFL|nr:hypothetical protein PS710_03734 [Pseudomonas fluorescens]